MNKKEEFTVNGKTYLTVQPCGMLYTFQREYFLLHPFPITADWELMADRFVCVPRKQVDEVEGEAVYPFARHVVTSAYAIDYCANMPWEIIEKLDENDLSETKWGDVVIYELDVEEDIEPEQDFNDIHPVRDVNDRIRERQEELYQDELDEMEKANNG